MSYSTKDDTFAGKLYRSLQDAGIRCWFAPEHLDIGAKIRPSLDKEILSRDAFIVILSAKSIESPWVEKEVETAFERKYRGELTSILPIRLDDAVLSSTQAWAADLRRSIYIGDFSDWEGPAYQRALERPLAELENQTQLRSFPVALQAARVWLARSPFLANLTVADPRAEWKANHRALAVSRLYSIDSANLRVARHPPGTQCRV